MNLFWCHMLRIGAVITVTALVYAQRAHGQISIDPDADADGDCVIEYVYAPDGRLRTCLVCYYGMIRQVAYCF